MKSDRAASFGSFDKVLAQKMSRRHLCDKVAADRVEREHRRVKESAKPT